MKISRRTMLMAGMVAGGRLLRWGGLGPSTALADMTGRPSIDRRALVRRHNPAIQQADPFSALTVGNGSFAFTADVTGLQTFNEEYRKQFPLCTSAHWGWHTTPAPAGLRA